MGALRSPTAILAAALLVLPAAPGAGQATAAGETAAPDIHNAPGKDPGQVVGEFLLLLLGSGQGKQQALAYVEQHWQPGFMPMLLEVLFFNREPSLSTQLVRLLERKTGQSFGYDIQDWYRWLWNQEPVMHADYPAFKRALYGLVDERFEAYFGPDAPALVRLDEVMWGGVAQDGIPPLHAPEMISAGQADYLADSDIVFGLQVNGDTRAYPQRILGWHELFTDRVGGVPVAGVYCTLCGTMILYKTSIGGVEHQLGTSGFLYRSNKLMYDRATGSLWSTLRGEPVIGPLATGDIRLERMAVVTTRWGEWRRRHPGTRVLSLATGYTRSYAEGAAYREYFASDELMFQVPVLDRRLANKAEVLGLVFGQYPEQPLAIAAAYLSGHPVYHDRIGNLDFVVLTDVSGANRVYLSGSTRFTTWDQLHTVVDEDGISWTLEETALVAGDGRQLHRLPAHRAFWFGWFSTYSHTRLVH